MSTFASELISQLVCEMSESLFGRLSAKYRRLFVSCGSQLAQMSAAAAALESL